MQQDATDLDNQRQRRLEEITDRENRAAEREEKARAHNARFGEGRADFVNGYRKRAGEFGLRERMGRQRHNGRDND